MGGYPLFRRQKSPSTRRLARTPASHPRRMVYAQVLGAALSLLAALPNLYAQEIQGVQGIGHPDAAQSSPLPPPTPPQDAPLLAPPTASTPAEAPLENLPQPKSMPQLSNAGSAPQIPMPQPEAIDQTFAINLATALRLAEARPLVIEAARASEVVAFAQLQRTRYLWLPDVNFGEDYQRHDGAQIRTTGEVAINSRNQFLAGAGVKTIFGLTDAIYAPLAAEQIDRARNFDVQAAQNDAQVAVTDAYFSVQQARGILGAYIDTESKANELVRKVRSLSSGLTAPIEVQRAEAALADLEQLTTLARQDWRVNSAALARVLRLNPGAVIVPLEPPHLQVTIIPLDEPVNQLIAEGLVSRPELASQQAIVRATAERLNEEKMRPFIPTVVVQPSSNPGNTLGAGIYGAGLVGQDPTWAGRSDWDFQLLWQLQNLGAGNVALVNERQGERQEANIQLLRLQDAISAEIVTARARVLAANTRVEQAQVGLVAAKASFEGNLKGLGETIRSGDQLQLTIRPQEATAALRALLQAYISYFSAVNDYNREQFRLYHALGYPAQSLAENQAWGEPQPCDCLAPASSGMPDKK